MGGSDWAGHMAIELKEMFGVERDRALRITGLVRHFVSMEGYEGVFGEQGTKQYENHQVLLINELEKSLYIQPGGTIEERWNNLMDRLDCQSRIDKAVYLVPWEQYDRASSRADDVGTTQVRTDGKYAYSKGDVTAAAQAWGCSEPAAILRSCRFSREMIKNLEKALSHPDMTPKLAKILSTKYVDLDYRVETSINLR